MNLGRDIPAPVEQVSDLRCTKNIFVQEGGVQMKVRVNGIIYAESQMHWGTPNWRSFFARIRPQCCHGLRQTVRLFFGKRNPYSFPLCLSIFVAYKYITRIKVLLHVCMYVCMYVYTCMCIRIYKLPNSTVSPCILIH